MADNSSQSTIAHGFAAELGYNLSNDYQYAGLSPHVVQLDPKRQRNFEHIVDNTGADYYAARIDFGGTKVVASRAFAIVMEGGRSGSAYLPKQAHPKKLTVIRGCGSLIIGNPENDDLDGAFMTDIYPLNAAITKEVTLPPGHFYTIEADKGTEVIVSCLSETDSNGNWELSEIVVEPGKESLEAPDEGLVVVPEEFMNADFS
jgi:hypothetical protein